MKQLIKNHIVNVLLIDAKPRFSSVVRKILQKYKLQKFQLLAVSSLSQALLFINNKNIDAILLNPNLFDSKGIKTFRELIKIDSSIPVILLTEIQDEALAIEAVSEGAQDYFIKENIDGNRLARSITYIIERKKHDILINAYTEIIENSSEAIFSLSTDGIIMSWNHAAESIYLYKSKEIIGMSIIKLIAVEHKEHLEFILKSIQSGKRVKEHEIVFRNKSGKKMHILITIAPTRNNLGVIVGASLIAQNYTKHKLSEEQLALQLRVATILAESKNLNNASRSILKTICSLLEFTAAEIWVVDRDENVLRYILNWDESNKLKEISEVSQKLVLHTGEGIPGFLWENPEPQWVTTLHKYAITQREKLLKTIGLNCYFGFPILFQGEVLGVLIFFGNDIEQPDHSYVKMFNAIGNQFGNFIKRKRLEKELLYLAQHDQLTGLANKLVTESALRDLINQAKKMDTKVAFLYFDIDDFKNINDTLGHNSGDLILKEVGKRLLKLTRETDLAARFGGDEFAVVLPDIISKQGVERIAKKILSIMAKPFVIDNKELSLTVSIGISLYPDDSLNEHDLQRFADLAMYQVKKSGRNNYLFSSPQLEVKENKKFDLERGLQKALLNNEFVLYYQPIVSIETNKIVSVEALIRWRKKSGELILPKDFIYQAEESNLMIEIGDWVLRTACRQIKEWHDCGLASVSVNISVQQLNDQFIQTLENILAETNLDPKCIILEITESLLMRQSELMATIINSLNCMGVRLSLDDFGTGYSSLAYLKHFAVHSIKIDSSFITDFEKHPKAGAIIESIIVMSRVLKMKCIAEGVETKKQLDFLKEKGCNEYQGYFYSKPLPPDVLLRILTNE